MCLIHQCFQINLLTTIIEQVSYKCNEGFEMRSTTDDDLLITLSNIECLSSAEWQTIFFECHPIVCNTDIDLNHGFTLKAL